MSGKYDDIIGLPHRVSPTRPRMTMAERAAQFSPFAALTGYDAAIQETARLTDAALLPAEDMLADLELQLQTLRARLGSGLPVTVTYFVPDARKAGGAYVTHTGIPKKLDEGARVLVFADGVTVPLDAVSGFTFSP